MKKAQSTLKSVAHLMRQSDPINLIGSLFGIQDTPEGKVAQDLSITK